MLEARGSRYVSFFHNGPPTMVKLNSYQLCCEDTRRVPTTRYVFSCMGPMRSETEESMGSMAAMIHKFAMVSRIHLWFGVGFCLSVA